MKISEKTDWLSKKIIKRRRLLSKDISWQKKIQAPRQSMRSFKPKKK